MLRSHREKETEGGKGKRTRGTDGEQRGASPCRTQNFDLKISSAAFSNYSARGNFNSTLILQQKPQTILSPSLLVNSVCIAKQVIYSIHFILCACSHSIISIIEVTNLRTDQAQSVFLS